jgi:uncharacterized membrane protein YcaP (DUF421 family)
MTSTVLAASIWARVFDHPSLSGALAIVGRTAVVFVVLIIGLRVLGKRELGQMTIYDLVLLVIVGNAVQNAMVGSDTTLVGGIVAVGVLLVLNRLLTIISGRSRRLARVLVGEPVLLVSDGHFLEGHLRRHGITHDQVFAALREHGVASLHGVKMAVLEVDGTISVVPLASTSYRTVHHYKGLHLP